MQVFQYGFPVLKLDFRLSTVIVSQQTGDMRHALGTGIEMPSAHDWIPCKAWINSVMVTVENYFNLSCKIL